MRKTSLVLGFLVLTFGLVACGGGGGDTDAGIVDGVTDAGGDGQATFVKPEGYASVTFFIDDKANQTYASSDLQWKGSFVYDPTSNIITYDAAWAGELGPYPVLYDDGPIAAGGHEMPGATADDHVFSVEVYVQAPADLTQEFQYGAINEFGNWIWEGSNGSFDLVPGTTDRLDADGYYIHGFGTYDLRVTLDIAQLNADFLPFDPAVNRIYLKGSMNSWEKRQLLDNGQKGDVAADDGIYTYWHAENLGPHDGMLYVGQHVQFVFMIDNFEYKRGDALSDGVDASTNCAAPEQWDTVPIIMENESRGRIKNTTVIMCEGAGGLTLSSIVPGSGSPEGGTAVQVYGSGFAEGAQVFFGEAAASDVIFVSEGQINCSTPAHEAGSVTVAVVNPGGDRGELSAGFAFATGDQPEILFVQPSLGSSAGGTDVTITGRNFASGATVQFAGLDATDVLVAGQDSITCSTPAHAPGAVTVIVTNPGGLVASFPNGFEYSDSTGPVIQRVEPAVGASTGGTAVTIIGGGFSSGANVQFDGQNAGDIQVMNSGAIACTAPAHAEGVVDLRVVNPDQQEDVLVAGFVYEKPKVDWAAMIGPMTVSFLAGQSSPMIFAQVYEPDVTPGDGCTGQITVELGYGPVDSLPADDDPNDPTWSWVAADCNVSCMSCDSNDEYMKELTIADGGNYQYAFRFSLDGETWVYADGGSGTLDGYLADDAGQASVQGGGGELQLWTVEPPMGSILGGTAVTLAGAGFESGCEVFFNQLAIGTTFVDSNTLQITTPAHAQGPLQVRVVNPGASHPETSLVGGYTYVLRHTPTIDGDLGVDWPAEHQVAENSTASSWGSNRLDALWVSFDDDNLYLGIQGWAEANNGIVIYLDKDFGSPNGIANMNDLTDEDGSIDALISSPIVVSAGGFAADFALASKGMASVTNPDLVQDAGLRGLIPVDDFSWLGATVATSDVEPGVGAVEIAVPWDSLFIGGLPGSGFR
ncbi:MAG: IPT/TIG domain-containing protein, partial [Deltaproteobacteria bacterium]|nr:IPT/TIG domain-containing protein [Deltaproteobacteria bacterium]